MKALRKYCICLLLFCGLATPAYAADVLVANASAETCARATIAAADYVGMGGTTANAQKLFMRIMSGNMALQKYSIDDRNIAIDRCRSVVLAKNVAKAVGLAGKAALDATGGVDGFIANLVTGAVSFVVD